MFSFNSLCVHKNQCPGPFLRHRHQNSVLCEVHCTEDNAIRFNALYLRSSTFLGQASSRLLWSYFWEELTPAIRSCGSIRDQGLEPSVGRSLFEWLWWRIAWIVYQHNRLPWKPGCKTVLAFAMFDRNRFTSINLNSFNKDQLINILYYCQVIPLAVF